APHLLLVPVHLLQQTWRHAVRGRDGAAGIHGRRAGERSRARAEAAAVGGTESRRHGSGARPGNVSMKAFLGLSVLCALCGGVFSGCAREPAQPAATAAPPPASQASSGGTIVGTDPRPANAVPIVIVLESKGTTEYPAQTEKPSMDQVSATFGPALLFVRTGQPAVFRNSDDTLHNVHVTHEETREPQFNVAIPTGESYSFTFKRAGFSHVR